MTQPGFAGIAASAARLFLSRGYRGVSLRELAEELGIKAASLYHHCPGGKAELYVRSLGWFLEGHAERVLKSRGRAAFPESILRMAVFTVGENHVDLRRIVQSDLPNLPPDKQAELSDCLHQAVLRPFVEVLDSAEAEGQVRQGLDSHMAAACVLAIADNLGGLHLPVARPPSQGELEAAKEAVRRGVQLLIRGTRA
jgi:AcrR family transcriptional regulator